MEENISLSKYVYFNCDDGRFYLTDEAQEILYRKKELICSYSGCNDWIDQFVHEMMNLYTGSSPYNYALGTCNHHTEFPRLWEEHRSEVTEWVRKSKEKIWGKSMYACIDYIIDTVPEHE